MSTDLYLTQPKPPHRGAWAVILLLLAALGLAAALFFKPAWLRKAPAPSVPARVVPVAQPVKPAPVAIPKPVPPPPPSPAPAPKAPTPAPPPTLPTVTAPAPASVPPTLPTAQPAGGAGTSKELTEAADLEKAEQFLAAREKAYAVLAQATNNTALRAMAEDLLGRVNMALILTPRAMPEKVEHVVASGDTLGGLAHKFGTTMELIRKSNRMRDNIVRLGQRLRVFSAPLAVSVSKTRNDLVLTAQDRFIKRYRVGTGKFGKTPVGTFTILSRLAQPPWTRPEDGKIIPYGDTNNVLGTHWLSLDVPGYGIHGTWEPETIGKQSSAGCIRLVNSDVEELFTLLPEGTKVTVTE